MHPGDANRVDGVSEFGRLTEFLTATQGLPAKLPDSAEPFIFFKGADALVSVSGGHLLEDALARRRVVDVIEYVSSGDVVRVESLRRVFEVCIRKYRGNQQRLKNAVLSVCECFDQIPDQELRTLALGVLLANDWLLQDFPLEQLRKLTPTRDDGRLEGEAVWSMVDELFRARTSDEDQRENFGDWILEYLCEILRQPHGLERTKLRPADVTTEQLLSVSLQEAMGDGYPAPLASLEHALAAYDTACETVFEPEVAERAALIISAGLAGVGKEVRDRLSDKLRAVGTALVAFLGSGEADGERLMAVARLLRATPSDARCPKEIWDEFGGLLDAQHSRLAGLVKRERVGVITLLVSLYAQSKGAYANLTPILKGAIGKVSEKDIEEITGKFQGWGWCGVIASHAKEEFRSRLGDKGVLAAMLRKATGSGADLMLELWDAYRSDAELPDIIAVLPRDAKSRVNQIDVINKVLQDPGGATPQLRWRVLRLLYDNHRPREEVASIVDAEMTSPTDVERIAQLAVELALRSPDLLEEYIDRARELLLEKSPPKWTRSEACWLIIAFATLEHRTNEELSRLADKATQCGVADAAEATVVASVSAEIIRVMRARPGVASAIMGPLEKSLRKSALLDDTVRESRLGELRDIQDQFGLEGGIIARAVRAVAGDSKGK